jgi:DNA-binding transcriptional regulator YiaG
MKRFKGNIKEIREKLEWSQEDLAHEVGVSLSTVQRWEKGGGARPSPLAVRELRRLFRKFDIDIEG